MGISSLVVTCQMSVMWMNGLPGKKEGTKQINREVNRLAIYSGTRGMLWKRHTYLISVMHGILSQNSSGFFSSNWIGPFKERFSMVDRETKLNGWSHLWWWKSWNSGENTIGKWKPEWSFCTWKLSQQNLRREKLKLIAEGKSCFGSLSPDPLHWNGWRCEKQPKPGPDCPGQKMLEGMGVQGCCGDGRNPLMMLLVDVLVNGLVMQKPEI